MGRKRKLHGKLYEGPRGKPVRLTISKAKFPPFIQKVPRGKTGSAYVFTKCLKEFAPFVYAFIVDELRKSEADRRPDLRRVIAEWRKASGSHRRPEARGLSAFAIERALDGAWQIWGIRPPFSEGEVDSFWRRYVLGHQKALRDFRTALREPRPWTPEHRGHWLKYFFGAPGTVAREFKLLRRQQEDWTIITPFEEP
jgi:hypothetical protein